MSAPQPPQPAPTLSDRLTKKLAAAREIVDPPTPIRLLIDGAMIVALVYLTVHFVHGLYADDTVNKAVLPLYWFGLAAMSLLDLGWSSKKHRAKLQRRREASSRWRETIAAHNARVLAQPPASPTTTEHTT